MSEPFRLFFRDIELGMIVENYADFPNLWGTFKMVDTIGEGELWHRLQDFIAQSIVGHGLMEDDKMNEWEQFENELGERFPDLIETEDWHLLIDDKRVLIMVPIFERNNGIVWRWN